MTWAHFEFEDGSNPYVAFTDERRDEVLKNCKELGYIVEEMTCFSDERVVFYNVRKEAK